MCRSAPQRCAMDPVGLLRLGLTPNRPLCRIGRNALVPQVSCEFPPPLAQRRPSDVQPFAVSSHCFHNQVHMGVWLVSMKHHRIAVLKPKLLPGEVFDGGQHLQGGVPAGIENMSF